MRGTGVAGLRGIAWQRALDDGTTLVRPMLGATHADALDFLRQIDQPWQEDHTNADVTRTRARLRRDVLPVLRELRPSAARKAVELGDTMRHIQARLDEAARTRPQ
jgi:tRNA(Ile)-lysidine synthase